MKQEWILILKQCAKIIFTHCLKPLLLLLLLLCLTSCGFRPRGVLPLPPSLYNIYLQTTDPYGELAHNLQDYLHASGVHLADSPKTANTVLVILSEQTLQQMLSVSGTQQTRQYNLILVVTFEVTDPNGKILLQPQVISETRTIPIQSNQVLAGSNEANNLYRQMRQAIVHDIMNRLSSRNVATILKKAP